MSVWARARCGDDDDAYNYCVHMKYAPKISALLVVILYAVVFLIYELTVKLQ
jgi:hypothetical protein